MNCDPLARWYRVLEFLTMGRALQRRRCEFLAEAQGAGMVLILGDGDGRFLQHLCGVDSQAVVHCVDSSAKMLAEARARAAERPQITFHHADARRWTPPEGMMYDLIVTHFFLDCFEEVEVAGMIHRYAAMVRPGGKWIVSEFHVPSAGWASWRARLWIGSLYRVFGWIAELKAKSLPRYRPALEAAGFRLERAVTAEGGMLISELWEKPTVEFVSP